MISPISAKVRGERLRQAMKTGGYGKATALAYALKISPAAITKWTQGKAMSVAHACMLADLLDVSLDWMLMGRNEPNWLQPNRLSDVEKQLIEELRERPSRVTRLLRRLVAEIQKLPTFERVESAK